MSEKHEIKGLKELESTFDGSLEQIKRVLEVLSGVDDSESYGDEIEILSDSYYNKENLVLGEYTLSNVASFGGMGKGDDYWFVFKVEKAGEETKHYKVPGWYASHQGGEYEYDDVFEVVPVPVERIEWHQKK